MIFFMIALAVFAITLVVTKSKLFGCKREFVEKRYESSKVGDQRPGIIHWWWHSMWSCPMCLGFWVAAIMAFLFPVYSWFVNWLALSAFNWLLHCLESTLFEMGAYFEQKEDDET